MSLTTQIKNANALGRQNLANKGVTTDGTETTYQIMSKIAEVTGGGSDVEYSNIVYNEDDTITLTQTNGIVRTMTCEYEDGKLVGLKYGNEVIPLTYEDDVLIGIGGMEVDLNNAPATSGGGAELDHTVTFMVDNEPYEIVSVKDGNSINAPINEPISENGNFNGWQINGVDVIFPYLPTDSIEINAHFSSLVGRLYTNYNVDKNTYPYVIIDYVTTSSYTQLTLAFAKECQPPTTNALYPSTPFKYGTYRSDWFFGYGGDAEGIVDLTIKKIATLKDSDSTGGFSGQVYTNVDISGSTYDNLHSL